MAKDLTAEDIARETYLFKYNMENGPGVIASILLLIVLVPYLILKAIYDEIKK